VSLGKHLHDLKRGDAPDTAGEAVECAHGRPSLPVGRTAPGGLPGRPEDTGSGGVWPSSMS
jgi:hypothetical protein